jgi:hypothetical protein
MFLKEVNVNIQTAHLIGNRHTKKDNTCGVEGGIMLTSFKYAINVKTPITVAQKAQQFARLSTRLMMAE